MNKSIKFTLSKIYKILCSFIVSIAFFLLVPYQSFSSGYNNPEKAFYSYVKAIQIKNLDKAFSIDYNQQKMAYGKFGFETSEQKKQFAKSFEGDPSICPGTTGYPKIPCDTNNIRNKVNAIRLLIPKQAEYDITETIRNNEQARMLVKIVYSEENYPVVVTDVDTIVWINVEESQSDSIRQAQDRLKKKVTQGPAYYSESEPPIILPNRGILTINNLFFSVKSIVGDYSIKWPIKYVRKDIMKMYIEVNAIRMDENWYIYSIDPIDHKISYFDHNYSTNQFDESDRQSTITQLKQLKKRSVSKRSLEITKLYKIEVAFEVERHWAFPQQMADESKALQAQIVFRVLPNGDITDIRFTQKSGNSHLDDSAYRAVVKANPVSPHPAVIRVPYVTVALRFSPEGLRK